MDSGAWRGFPFDWYPPAPVLVFPFPPMLAALKHNLPIGDQWLYEPKLDGFRGLQREVGTDSPRFGHERHEPVRNPDGLEDTTNG